MTAETTASITRGAKDVSSAPPTPFVAQPTSIDDTGLDLALLVDLVLKAIHFSGRPSGRQLAEQLALSFPVMEEVITFLRQEQAVEVVGSAGVGEQAYQYALTGRGVEKAEEALGRNQYVGPAPVPFSLYIDILKRQSIRDVHIDRDTFRDRLSHLVLSRKVLAPLGPAVNSARSVFIYGEPGNGKTSITLAIGTMLPGQVLIPYAIETHGQIIKVFDPRLHHPVAEETDEDHRLAGSAQRSNGLERRRDRRWVQTKRPIVTAGGELTLEDLELRYSPVSKFYIAPLQWKANTGVLVIDDFGRQAVQPQELLNRWIVPMEQGVDHLFLHSGDTVEVPFETLLIFSTNIPPGKLGDEAFFRRIRHKVQVPDPSEEEFLEILQRVCKERDVPYSDEGARYLMDVYYHKTGRSYRGCHPRDLIDLLSDITRFYGEKPALTPEWIDLASSSYFVDTEV
ncbi:MAG: ATP-binding protein [Chloroflexi bacterium]|nr:ATP-binding protein [Chloroflexota bacterium]